VIEWITANKVPKMGHDERGNLVKDLTVINDFRHKQGEIDLDLDKTLARHFTSLEDEERKKTRLREQRRSVTAYHSDSSECSIYESSDSSDGYDSSDNHKVEAASSEIDEDDELFAPLNGYDASGNARADVDLTLTCTREDTQTDIVMEDYIIANKEVTTVPQDNNNALHHLKLSKYLKLFLNDVIGMTRCPISREQMIHPFVAPDTYSYGKDKISEWLSKKKISPLTRDIMDMFMLMQYHTIQRVIKSMKDYNIIESVIETLGTTEDTTSSTAAMHPPSEPTESIANGSNNTSQHICKKRKKTQKSIRLKKNRKAKENALKVLKTILLI